MTGLRKLGMTFAAAVVFVAIAAAPARAQGTFLKAQVGLSVTNGAAVQPSLCSDAGVCAGTPTWNNSTNKNQILGCSITIETANVRWTSASGANPPTTANGQLWVPGNYYIAGRTNVQNFKVIATTATNATVTFICNRT